MKYGRSIPDLTTEDVERFWTNVDRSGECWEWTGERGRSYGRFALNGAQYSAHRVSWMIETGVEPRGEVLDHLCSNPGCVRPAHLEEVSQAENCRRGENGYGSRSICRSGLHDISSPDDHTIGAHGRQCRECRKISQRKYNAKRRSKAGRPEPVEEVPRG